jgi:hypothetical protein
MFYRLDFSQEKTGQSGVGPDLFYPSARSRYSGSGEDQITYTGSIRGEYSFLGVGMALEKSFWDS